MHYRGMHAQTASLQVTCTIIEEFPDRHSYSISLNKYRNTTNSNNMVEVITANTSDMMWRDQSSLFLHSLSDGNAQKWPILFTLHVQVIPKIAHRVWTIVCSFLHTGGVQECANLLS